MTAILNVKSNNSNKYRIWKPLGLLTIAGLTPPEWNITIFDENLSIPNYSNIKKPDLVGITAFTSQANRAYKIADIFRSIGVPVVMGGIHATMCLEEALNRVDSVVMREAEGVWHQVLKDAKNGRLQRIYNGYPIEMDKIPIARHDLLHKGYKFGSIQTTRGCPLNCNFCSVSAFNGNTYRHRPIAHIIKELKIIKETLVLIVDDNVIGTSKNHIKRAKRLFHEIIKANIKEIMPSL